MLTPLASLRTGLELQLDASARNWLHRALSDAADAPAQPGGGGLPLWERHFAEAGRRCRTADGGTPTGDPAGTPAGLPADAPAGPAAGTPAAGTPGGPGCAVDTARLLLLHAAAPGTAALTRLYRHGSGDERRAVLLSLPHLDPPPEPAAALALVEDALRSNDTSLIAAAAGPYAAERLDVHAWRQAVLKCLFTGVPLTAVAGLERRAAGDAELARMLRDYARERTVAGRDVPEDLTHALKLASAEGPPGGPGPELP